MLELYKLLNKPLQIIDTHAHINSAEFNNDLEMVIESSANSELEQIFDIGTTIDSSKKSISISKKSFKLKSFVGVDPECFIPNSSIFLDLNKKEQWFELQYLSLESLILENKKFVRGIGETGLDFYWLKNGHNIDSQTYKTSVYLQEKLFRVHLELAKKYNLPLSIHSRGAEERCLEIIKEYDNIYGIFHSYTGNYSVAKNILDAGWGLGVNGIVTFKNANELRGIYKKIIGDISHDKEPSDFYKKGIYFETDSPFLSPEGKRGERNIPLNVILIYQQFLHMLKDV